MLQRLFSCDPSYSACLGLLWHTRSTYAPPISKPHSLLQLLQLYETAQEPQTPAYFSAESFCTNSQRPDVGIMGRHLHDTIMPGTENNTAVEYETVHPTA
ncbi:unnamed protein product [Ectocarpus sp. 8 AP-2014]